MRVLPLLKGQLGHSGSLPPIGPERGYHQTRPFLDQETNDHESEILCWLGKLSNDRCWLEPAYPIAAVV